MSILRFTGTATRWLECLPLGDGRLGVMTDGGVSTARLHLNDATAWSGSPSSELAEGAPDAATCAALLTEARTAIAAGDPIAAEAPLQAMQTRYAQSFLPLGELIVNVEAPRDGGDSDDGGLHRELDLSTGIHRSQTSTVRTTTFIATESVLVHVIEGARSVRIKLSSPLQGPDSERPQVWSDDEGRTGLLLRLPSDVAPGHEPDLPPARWSREPAAALRAAIVARVIPDEHRTVILASTATTFAGLGRIPAGNALDALESARQKVDAAASVPVEELRAASEDAMRAMLGDVSLSFGQSRVPDDQDTAARLAAARRDERGVLAADPDLAALLFDYGRYLLVSASRPGGPPANLQGLWNAEMRPPWGSGYTLNINTEMNYWGAHVTGLSAHASPLTDFTLALADAAAVHTRRLYDAPGWTVHHNSDIWLYATAAGRGTGDPRWAFWPLGGAWLASRMVDAHEFGAADRDDLTRVWPALRGAAEFGLAWHQDGMTSPSTSPENAFLVDGRPASLASTTTMDLALLRALFERTVRTAHTLDLDDDPVVKAASERLGTLPAAAPIAPDGTVLEWDEPRIEEDRHHRHVSHLFGLFPGDERWDERHRAAAIATLERRGDDASGWSLAWKLALWARLGRADKVADLLALFLRDADGRSGPWSGGLYPNLFAAHPPFQIDGNLGYVGALTESLLQSVDGIHLLPAVPTELSTGQVTGLVARPGITVDICWDAGVLVDARLRARHSSAAGPHLVRWRDRTITVDIDNDHGIRIDAHSFDSEEDHL